MQLLPTVELNSVEISLRSSTSRSKFNQGTYSIIFDDELQSLWVQGVETDKEWQQIREAVKNGEKGEKGLPPGIAMKTKVKIVECSVAADDVPRGRENRIWVPDFEQLRTVIVQHIHDSHFIGHPGRDTMV